MSSADRIEHVLKTNRAVSITVPKRNDVAAMDFLKRKSAVRGRKDPSIKA